MLLISAPNGMDLSDLVGALQNKIDNSLTLDHDELSEVIHGSIFENSPLAALLSRQSTIIFTVKHSWPIHFIKEHVLPAFEGQSLIWIALDNVLNPGDISDNPNISIFKPKIRNPSPENLALAITNFVWSRHISSSPKVRGAHPRGSCWVHDEKRICYINIPRCASTSIKKALFDQGFHVSNFFEHDYSDYFSFAVIRDPTRRVISGWKERSREIHAKENIQKTIREICNGKGCWLERQSWFLEGIELDFLIRLEFMIEDRQRLDNIIGPDTLKPWGHIGPPGYSKIKNVLWDLTRDDLRIIRQHYATDFQIYACPSLALKPDAIQRQDCCQ